MDRNGFLTSPVLRVREVSRILIMLDKTFSWSSQCHDRRVLQLWKEHIPFLSLISQIKLEQGSPHLCSRIPAWTGEVPPAHGVSY